MKEMLDEKFLDKDGETKKCYEKVSADQALSKHTTVCQVLQAGYNSGNISDHEFRAMTPQEPKYGRFYGTCKDHKPYTRIPDFRPIASICGSITERIGAYVDYHIRHLIQYIPTHLDDTPDFLRQLEQLKATVGTFPDDVVPVTIDVSKLFPSIPIEEGVTAVEEALRKKSKCCDNQFCHKFAETGADLQHC